jgi:hypothetical protein
MYYNYERDRLITAEYFPFKFSVAYVIIYKNFNVGQRIADIYNNCFCSENPAHQDIEVIKSSILKMLTGLKNELLLRIESAPITEIMSFADYYSEEYFNSRYMYYTGEMRFELGIVRNREVAYNFGNAEIAEINHHFDYRIAGRLLKLQVLLESCKTFEERSEVIDNYHRLLLDYVQLFHEVYSS